MKYAIYIKGSFVNDIHLRGGTKNGTYWASYTPENEKLNSQNMWITNDFQMASGVAMLVGGKVVPLEEVS